jgi:transcriptional regulator with PAS, ATPase and Fis domain
MAGKPRCVDRVAVTSYNDHCLEVVKAKTEGVVRVRDRGGMGRQNTFDGMIGACGKMRRIFAQIRRVSGLDIPVLIVGESGTGKELVAMSIHRRSLRSDYPFVPVNTGAIVKELIESEIFGHEKGAFTGASYQKKGKFEVAKGGTLFLDEISAMDEKTQVSLLRVLETKRFQRVGGNRSIETDVRIIAATNENLRQAIREGRFRRDLFHRLNVFPIRIPSLRDRGEDITLLVDYFLRRYCKELDRNVPGLSPQAMLLLKSYRWPGNVRELENVMMRTVVMLEQDTITPEILPDIILQDGRETVEKDVVLEVGLTLEEAEKRYITKTLELVGGNKSKAARILGLSRKAIYNKLKSYGLQR